MYQRTNSVFVLNRVPNFLIQNAMVDNPLNYNVNIFHGDVSYSGELKLMKQRSRVVFLNYTHDLEKIKKWQLSRKALITSSYGSRTQTVDLGCFLSGLDQLNT